MQICIFRYVRLYCTFNYYKDEHMLKGLLLTCLVISFTASAANPNLKSEFNTTYKAYQEAVKAKDTTSLLALAEKSYVLGCDVYGKNTINCGSLTLNYAHQLSTDVRKMNALFEEALVIYIKKYGENALEIADIYQQIAEKNSGPKNRKSRVASKEALEIADALSEKSPIASAQIKFQIGKVLLNNHSKLSKVLLEANDEFEKILANNDTRLVESRFWAAKYFQAKGKTEKSIIPLEKNINVFNQIEGATHPYELVSRAYLVKAYEKVHESEKATEHCIAIGEMTPWDNDQEQMPIYRVEPLYPISQARKGNEGWVQIEFTIDENGFVKDPTVLASNGANSFITESLKAIKKWRYAPKFENGHAIAAKSTVQLDFKVSA